MQSTTEFSTHQAVGEVAAESVTHVPGQTAPAVFTFLDNEDTVGVCDLDGNCN